MLLNNYNKTWNISGKLFSLDEVKIMGILNCTPDSFYAKSRVEDEKILLQSVEKMMNEGADIIDIGGESSRPGAPAVSAKTELQRIIPAIQTIRRFFPEAILSVDTYKSEVAKAAIIAGCNIVNDISFGTFDKKMFETIAMLDVPYIGMHISNKPLTMQQHTLYNDIMTDIISFLDERISLARIAGMKDIAIDVGFGFGKTQEDNFKLLSHLYEFKMLNCPILVGISRKSMIYKTLQTEPENAINGTSILNTIAVKNGANILRVHDVKEAREAIILLSKMQ